MSPNIAILRFGWAASYNSESDEWTLYHRIHGTATAWFDDKGFACNGIRVRLVPDKLIEALLSAQKNLKSVGCS